MAGVFFWFFFGQAKKNKARRRRYAPQQKQNFVNGLHFKGSYTHHSTNATTQHPPTDPFTSVQEDSRNCAPSLFQHYEFKITNYE